MESEGKWQITGKINSKECSHDKNCSNSKNIQKLSCSMEMYILHMWYNTAAVTTMFQNHHEHRYNTGKYMLHGEAYRGVSGSQLTLWIWAQSASITGTDSSSTGPDNWHHQHTMLSRCCRTIMHTAVTADTLTAFINSCLTLCHDDRHCSAMLTHVFASIPG